jgi:hypothetical protein
VTVTSPSSLLLAHAPDRSPSCRLCFTLVLQVFAGFCRPRLDIDPSRRYLCVSFPRCLAPYSGGPKKCICLFLPPCHRPSPDEEWVGFPLLSANTTFHGVAISELQTFHSVQASEFAHLPGRSYRCACSAGQPRFFYVRAYRALLPPHAPDMLAARTQAIGGVGTFTRPDSQPCRLLPSPRNLSSSRSTCCQIWIRAVDYPYPEGFAPSRPIFRGSQMAKSPFVNS